MSRYLYIVLGGFLHILGAPSVQSLSISASELVFVCGRYRKCLRGSRTWISLDIARFYEKHCPPSSGSAWPACPKTIVGPPLLGAGGVDTICTGFAIPL